MAQFKITRGLHIDLAGAPKPQTAETPAAKRFAVYPTEYTGIKPRLKIKEGDTVQRGTPLVFDKKNPAFQICSPAAGVVTAIEFGKRRVLERIIIEAAGNETDVAYPVQTADALLKADGTAIFDALQQTGLSALLIARPFSRMAQPGAWPKSIFVNAMNTAAFQPDINVLIPGQEAAFQAGLNALTRLTPGKVHLVLDGAAANAAALTSAKNVEVHTFSGPHPAGNTSVHIHHLDAISPGDLVWTIKARDVIVLGQFLTTGRYPVERVVSLGGPGVREEATGYYRIRLGAPLAGLLNGRLLDGAQRVVSGDFLSGPAIAGATDASLRLYDGGFTVLPEDHERHFMGWLAPGHNRFSASRTFVSRWFGGGKNWKLGTNNRGELRPMVLTGLYDRYLPMNIMTDFLVRAVLARDADEAIALGLLETDPEDFALCSFVCPSKMDLCGIIRKGLDQIEKEGI
jgi:Na+-transporting NADH:ubiquinone oxidoreductase subunit A